MHFCPCFDLEIGIIIDSSKPAGATPCSTDNTRCAGGVRMVVVFSEQECDLVTVLEWINQILLLKKPYSVHMRVFEILLIFEAT